MITKAATVALADLKIGDCVKDVNTLPNQVSDLPLVTCETAHNGEIFAITDDNDASPTDWGEQYCIDQYSSYIGVDFNMATLDVIYFGPQTAADKDKRLICVVYDKSGATTTGSLKGSQK